MVSVYDRQILRKKKLFDINDYSEEFQDLADKIVEIIGDYRIEDSIGIDKKRVLQWVSQFEEVDRRFLLEELLHILPTSYITKNDAIALIEDSIEQFSKELSYPSAVEFIANTFFLSCQAKEKSQTILLELLSVTLMNKYNCSLNVCDANNAKQIFYIDDVLATGGTLFRDLCTETDKRITENKLDASNIISLFFICHHWGMKNVFSRLKRKYGDSIEGKVKIWYDALIENDPYCYNFTDNSCLNFIYPMKSDKGQQFLDNIGKYGLKQDNWYNEQHAFRSKQFPEGKDVFRSEENRNRYENILLEKGIEIMDRVQKMNNNTRPLGYTMPSYKTLGTGTHMFTWRNISNTCPLVYWWSVNGWFPLFEPKNRGR